MSQKEVYLKIGEVAAFFGVSVKAVRLYEKKGIIRPARVDPDTGYRYYTADQVQVLNALVELKALGFTLREIQRALAHGIHSEHFREALRRKHTAWQEAVTVAAHKMESIERLSERVCGAKGGGAMRELTEEERAWELVRMVCVEDVKAQHTLSEAIWL